MVNEIGHWALILMLDYALSCHAVLQSVSGDWQ
jgi:hypothetical protein